MFVEDFKAGRAVEVIIVKNGTAVINSQKREAWIVFWKEKSIIVEQYVRSVSLY